MLHLLFANYVIKPFELMVVVYLKWHRMQVNSYIYNLKKLVKTSVRFHWILEVFPQSPSLRLFFHQESKLSKLKYCKHFRQLTPVFHFLQLMAVKNYSEMFPDSDTAKWCKQSGTKIKYSNQFGLAPYFPQSLQDNFLGRAFFF